MSASPKSKKGLFLGFSWEIVRADDDVWTHSTAAGQATYKLALLRVVSSRGNTGWLIFAGKYQFFWFRPRKQNNNPKFA